MEFDPTTVHSFIKEHPAITTPVLCLIIGEHVWEQPSFAGVSGDDEEISDDKIVSNLLESHPKDWFKICDSIDQLIDKGRVFMNDNGNLYDISAYDHIVV